MLSEMVELNKLNYCNEIAQYQQISEKICFIIKLIYKLASFDIRQDDSLDIRSDSSRAWIAVAPNGGNLAEN
jgi:hypothetical protein